MRRARLFPSMAGLALLLAACGGGSEASGDGPIKIMTLASFESQVYSVPWVKTAVQAAVDDLNAKGGIDGRKVQVTTCNDKFDPNEATACAQRAVSEKAVALVGGVTPNSGVIAPILEAAKIPFIGPGGADGAAESTRKVMYPINAGPVGFAAGAGQLAVTKGGKNVVVIAGENDSARAGGEWTKRGVQSAGGTATMVYAPLGAADYSAVVAKALSGRPQGIAVSGAGTDMGRIIAGLRDSGYEGVIAGQSSVVTADTLKALGKKADGIMLTSRGRPAGDTSNPVIKQFNDAMRAADPKVNIDDLGLNAWLSVKVFAAVTTGRAVTDGASVIEALEAIKTPIDLGGVYPPYKGVQNPPPLPEYPRVASFQVMTSTIKDGKIIPAGSFFDPFRK